MSIKAGTFLTYGGTVLLDRLQNSGVSSLGIPEEVIHETGNAQTVATVRDVPDLTWSAESLDVACEFEALLTGADSTAITAHQAFDFNNAMPLDIVSPFKTSLTNFAVIRGVATPYLTLENVTYRFGVKANATQQYTLRGDSVFYIPGTPYTQTFNVTASTNQVYTLAHTAIAYTEAGNTLYALGVCARNTSTHAFKRLLFGDYSNTSTTVTVAEDLSTEGYTSLTVVYGSATAATYNQTVHEGVSVKPAAVRGKDIDVYLSDGAATPTLVRLLGVQSAEVTRRVTLDTDEQFGSQHYVSQDYDIADVSGNLVVKPADATALFNLIANVTNVQTSVVAGPQSSAALSMEIRISSPDTGAVLKTIYVSDARFDPPAIAARVQQKLTPTFPWKSDGGNIVVYNGTRT